MILVQLYSDISVDDFLSILNEKLSTDNYTFRYSDNSYQYNKTNGFYDDGIWMETGPQLTGLSFSILNKIKSKHKIAFNLSNDNINRSYSDSHCEFANMLLKHFSDYVLSVNIYSNYLTHK